MPSDPWSGRDMQQRARDIIDALQAIRSYIAGMSQAQYLSDRKTQSAVERELLTIAEACAKILAMDDSVESSFPTVAWRAIRGMGSIIRHEYGRVDPSIVWNTVTAGDLDALAKAVEAL